MLEKPTLTDLRNSLEKIHQAILTERSDGEVPTMEALMRLKGQHPDLVRSLTNQLIDIALTKLNNEVSNRKGPKVKGESGFDLFGQYHSIPKMISVGKGRKKDTSKVTFQEGDLWLAAHAAQVDETKNSEFRRLLDENRSYALSPDCTIEAALQRRIEARQ